jgi:hypothetical protein
MVTEVEVILALAINSMSRVVHVFASMIDNKAITGRQVLERGRSDENLRDQHG